MTKVLPIVLSVFNVNIIDSDMILSEYLLCAPLLLTSWSNSELTSWSNSVDGFVTDHGLYHVNPVVIFILAIMLSFTPARSERRRRSAGEEKGGQSAPKNSLT